ncbi:uncharacterized protein RB166_008048 [Leptodactylus fuscus]
MNRYSFLSLFPVKEITYSTPPYMSIRRNGTEVLHLPVTGRKLMDMIKKFDPNDISYIEDSSIIQRFQREDITAIRDPVNKYFVIVGDNVWAKHLQGVNLQLIDIIDDKKDYHEVVFIQVTARSSLNHLHLQTDLVLELDEDLRSETYI